LLPQMTDDEIAEMIRQEDIRRLALADDATRREMLSTMDECPCCKRWLGHNEPPADDADPPPKTSFDFD